MAPKWSLCFQASVQLQPSTSSAAAGARRQTRGSPSGTSAGQQERQKARAHLSSYTRPSVRGFHEAGHANQSEARAAEEGGNRKEKLEQNTTKQTQTHKESIHTHSVVLKSWRSKNRWDGDEDCDARLKPAAWCPSTRTRSRSDRHGEAVQVFTCSRCTDWRTAPFTCNFIIIFQRNYNEIKSIIVAIVIILSSQSMCRHLIELQFLPAKLKNALFFARLKTFCASFV